MGTPRFWTAERDALAMRLVAEQGTTAEVARAVGVSRSALEMRVRTQGWPRRDLAGERVAAALETTAKAKALRETGATKYQIAAALGVNPSSVWDILNPGRKGRAPQPEPAEPKLEPTPRTCIPCGQVFLSRHPKSTHRLCGCTYQIDGYQHLAVCTVEHAFAGIRVRG